MNMINILELYSSDEVFKDIKLYDEIEKNILVNTIIQKVALYEPMYHEIELLNYFIKLWFERNYITFERLFKAYKQEFNPIHNYDRYDEESHENDTQSSSQDNYNETNTNKVSPFDTIEFVNDTQNINNNTDINNTDTKNQFKRKNHSYGNIGITQATTMLENYFNLIPKINIYELIANMFFDEFMIKCF